MVEIGSLKLSTPFLQAPMAGFSNDAWRRILLKFGGVGLLASEMMHARGSLEMERRRKTLHGRLFGLPLRNDTASWEATHLASQALPKTEPLRNLTSSGARRVASHVPLSVQIWDNQPEALAEFAEKLVRDYDIQAIDMNFGCPAPDVVQKAHCGSWLMQFPEKIGELASAVVAAVESASAEIGLVEPIPVTAKIRLGFSEERLTYLETAKILESVGVSAVTVHGRTARQMYTGQANWERIAEVKASVSIPVIGNGDIRTPEQACDALRRYGVDGVMIGRAALNEPWIFQQADSLWRGDGEAFQKPSASFQRGLLMEHFNVLLEQFSETEAVMLMRKFAPRYGIGLKNARQFRIQVVKTKTAVEFREAVENFFPE